jgi:DNA-binding MarR family transcriptional regulator
MVDGREVTDDQRMQAGILARLLGEIISGMKPRGHKSPPVGLIEAFLLVCLDEGLSVEEYAARGKIPYVTMSRHLLDLGDRNRNGEPGMKLITARANPLNRRQREYMLTEQGRLLLEKMLLVLHRLSNPQRK